MMSWPFDMFEAAPFLTGELAGDCGFDVLRIVKSEEQLFILREAEIKHARLSLLCSIGWPMSELFHYKFSQSFGLENLLQFGQAPSVLNGGLDNIPVIAALGGFFAIASLLELELLRRKQETPDYLKNFFNLWNEDGFDVPGNYNFDPLKLGDLICRKDKEKKKLIQTMEIFNGRMAMLASVGYVVQEYYTGLPVIDQTPQFFLPLWN